MSPISNVGPGASDPAAPGAANPSLVYRDDPHTAAVDAASRRATTVSRRFGARQQPLTTPGAGTDDRSDQETSDGDTDGGGEQR